MNLLKASFYSSLSTAVRLFSALIIVKVIAVYVGPAGLGKMGQFMSLMTIISVLAGGGISNGIIKYVSEYRSDENQLNKLLSTGFIYMVICSLVVAIVGVIFRNELAIYLLGSKNYVDVILVLIFGQFFIAANNFLVAIVNGYKDVKRLTSLNVCGTFVGLFLLVIMIRYYHLYGGLIGLVMMQAILIFITGFYIWRADWFKFNFLSINFDKTKIQQLAKFSMMAVTTALVTPLAQIIIRNHVQHLFSWRDVGYWQAICRISDVYLLFITTSLTVYYLPRLAEINDKLALRDEIIKSYKTIMPIVILAASTIYLCRNFIINALFTADFSPMVNLFMFQLIGDVLKIGSWLLSFLMLAKAMTKMYIFTEIIFTISLISISWLFLDYFGLIGLTYAFAANSLLYWVTMGLGFKNLFPKFEQMNFFKQSSNEKNLI